MENIVLYTSLTLAIFSLVMTLYALVRLGKFIRLAESADFDSLMNLSGDLQVTRNQVKKMNLRLNGFQKQEQHQYTQEQLQELAAQSNEPGNVLGIARGG